MFISPRIKCLSWLSTKLMAARYTFNSINCTWIFHELTPAKQYVRLIVFFISAFFCILAFSFDLSMPFSAFECIFKFIAWHKWTICHLFFIKNSWRIFQQFRKKTPFETVLMQMHRGTFFSSVWLVCAHPKFSVTTTSHLHRIWFHLLQTLSRSFPLTRTPTAAHFIVNNATCFLFQFKVMLRTSFHFVLRNYVIYKMNSIYSIIMVRKKRKKSDRKCRKRREKNANGRA